MAFSVPKDRWILFLLAPMSLELSDTATSTLIDAQKAFSGRVEQLLKEDGLKHLDLTYDSDEKASHAIDNDQYLSFLIYCSYVGHGIGLYEIDKKDFKELDELVTDRTTDRTPKAIDDLKELCYQFDILINELEYELESESHDNLFSLCTNFIDKLVDTE
jgi:hypothetical protein